MENKQSTIERINKKFQLDRFPRRALIDLPEHAIELAEAEGDRDLNSPPYDRIITFVQDLPSWGAFLQKVHDEQLLSEEGVVYFLYPKKGNKVYENYIHRDEIFPGLNVQDEDGYFQGTDLKFNQMFSLNDIFTVVGVKKLSKRPKPSSAPSQRVGDYEERIPEVRALLDEEALAIYDELTPGYKRNYARYILGVKTEATKQKRLQTAIEALKSGVKAI